MLAGMSMIHRLTKIAVLAAALAAGRPVAFADKPAANKDTVSDADAQRFSVFFEKLVAIVVANQDDCGKMAAALNTHMDANQAVLKAAADAKNHNKELPQAVKDKLAKQASEQLAPAMMKRCANDKPVLDAFLRMKPPEPPAK